MTNSNGLVQGFRLVCTFDVPGIVLTMDFPFFVRRMLSTWLCCSMISLRLSFRSYRHCLDNGFPPFFVQRMLPAWLPCSNISPYLYFRCYRHCLIQGCPLVYTFEVTGIVLTKDFPSFCTKDVTGMIVLFKNFPLFVFSMLPALSSSRMPPCLCFRCSGHFLVKGFPLVCTFNVAGIVLFKDVPLFVLSK